jgi:hypothetical protein
MEASKAQLEGLTLREMETSIACDQCDTVIDLNNVPGVRPENAGWLYEKRKAKSWRDTADVTLLCPRCRVAEETEQATLSGVVRDD